MNYGYAIASTTVSAGGDRIPVVRVTEAVNEGAIAITGGIPIQYTTTLANKLEAGWVDALAFTTPIAYSMTDLAQIQVGNQVFFVESGVEAGANNIPVYGRLLGDEVAIGTEVRYWQIVGGFPVEITQYVPPNSTVIPVAPLTQAIASGVRLVFEQFNFEPIFQLVVEAETTIEIIASLRSLDYSLEPTIAEEIVTTFKRWPVFGASESVSSIETTIEIKGVLLLGNETNLSWQFLTLSNIFDLSQTQLLEIGN